jgi:hypothetical protein
VYWPGLGYLPVAELVLRRLLPLAYEGLDRWGVAASERDRLLGVVERRVLTGANGAAWQAATVQRLESDGLDRFEALRETLRLYIERMHANRPVHEW